MVTNGFFVSIFLYLICFIYLFQANTDRFAWILGLVLNIITPFFVLSEIIYAYSDTYYKYYFLVCISLGLLFEFIALVMVVMEYHFIQTAKPNHEPDGQYKREMQHVMDTFEQVKFLFVTTVTLVWASIGNFFSEYTSPTGVDNSTQQNNYQSSSGRLIQWILNLIPESFRVGELAWKGWLDSIKMDAMIKAFLLFCIGFLVSFFGIFLRLGTTTYLNEQGLPIRDFSVVNLPETDGLDLTAIASFSIGFIVAIAVCIIMIGCMFFVPSLYNNSHIVLSALGASIIPIILIIFFVLWATSARDILDANDFLESRKIIFHVMTILFAIIGTPIVYSILDLIARFFFGGRGTLSQYLITSEKLGPVNYVGWLLLTCFVVMFVLSAFMIQK